jgi:hypothetical protein
MEDVDPLDHDAVLPGKLLSPLRMACCAFIVKGSSETSGVTYTVIQHYILQTSISE